MISIFYAFAAAVFYALSIPLSKLLLSQLPPVLMASILYFGAGFGVALLWLIFGWKVQDKQSLLSKEDLPYTILMVILDIAAPILLMKGVSLGNAGNASLLSNFEIVATTLIAFTFFKEKVSVKLWVGILLITAASFFLSINDLSSFRPSLSSLLVIGATLCWGLENNCTKKISSKNTYEIVIIKGIGSGIGSLLIAAFCGQVEITQLQNHNILIFLGLLLGFASYGLSIFLYIKSQEKIGAARTSAFYASAPFVGCLLSTLLLKESLNLSFLSGLILMILGTILVIADIN